MSCSEKGAKCSNCEQENAQKSSKRGKWKRRSKVWEKVAWFTRKTKLHRDGNNASTRSTLVQDENPVPSTSSCDIEVTSDGGVAIPVPSSRYDKKISSAKGKHSYLKKRKQRKRSTSSWNVDEDRSLDDLRPATGTFHDFESDKRISKEKRIDGSNDSKLDEPAREVGPLQMGSHFNVQSCNVLCKTEYCNDEKNILCDNCSREPSTDRTLQRSASFGGVGYYSWPRNGKSNVSLGNSLYEVWSPTPNKHKRCSNIRKMHTFHEKFTPRRDRCSCCKQYNSTKSFGLNLSDSHKDIVNQNGLNIGVIHYFKSPNCHEKYPELNGYPTQTEELVVKESQAIIEGINQIMSVKDESCDGLAEASSSALPADKQIPNVSTTDIPGSVNELTNSNKDFSSGNISPEIHPSAHDFADTPTIECNSTELGTQLDQLIIEDLNTWKRLDSINIITESSKCNDGLEITKVNGVLDDGNAVGYCPDKLCKDNGFQVVCETNNEILELSSTNVEYFRNSTTLALLNEQDDCSETLVSMETFSTDDTGSLYSNTSNITPTVNTQQESLTMFDLGSSISLPSDSDSLNLIDSQCSESEGVNLTDSQGNLVKDLLQEAENMVGSSCSLSSLEENIEKVSKLVKEELCSSTSSTTIKRLECLKKPEDIHRNSLSETDSGMESGIDDESLGGKTSKLRTNGDSLIEEIVFSQSVKSDRELKEESNCIEKKSKSEMRRDLVRRSSSRRLTVLKARYCKPQVDGNLFKQRVETILDWFGECNDEQRNIMIKRVLEKCGLPQMHMLSVAMEPVLHKSCPPSCQDMLAWLPYMLTRKILSYLDPVSLCRCSQVNKLWKNFIQDPFFWQRLCRCPDWQLSRVGECKQLLENASPDGSVQWRKLFQERFLLRKNWLKGNYDVRTFEGHTQGISCVQFDDTRIVSGSSDKTIKMWDIESPDSQAVLTLVGHSGTVRCLNLNGNRLVSGSMDRTIKVWDLSFESYWTGASCKVTMVGHMHTVRCLQVDDDKVVSGSYDKTLKVWDLKTGQCRLTLRGHNSAVLCVQFDDMKIVSGSYDKTIKVWNLVEGTCLSTLSGHHDAVTCLNLTFDGAKVISGSLDHNLKFWDLSTGKCISTLDWIRSEGHTGVVRCLQTDSWRIVSAGDDKTLKVWSLEGGQRLLTLRCHTDGVTCLQFTDYMIVSGSYDKTVKLWDFTPKLS